MWCFGVLVHPNFGLGGRGKAQLIHLGMSFYYANTGIKTKLQHTSHAKVVFAISVILPIHGLQNGVVSPAKEAQTLKHRNESQVIRNQTASCKLFQLQGSTQAIQTREDNTFCKVAARTKHASEAVSRGRVGKGARIFEVAHRGHLPWRGSPNSRGTRRLTGWRAKSLLPRNT